MKTNFKKRLWRISAILLAIIILFLTYIQLWYHPPLTKGPDLVHQKQVWKEHTAPVFAAKFSPDGRFAVSGSVDSTALIREVVSGKILHTLKHPEGITYVCYSKKGDLVITSSFDKIVRVWSVVTGGLLKELKGQKTVIRSLDSSPDGETIASGGEDGEIRLWNAHTGNNFLSIPAHGRTIWDLKFSPDGNSLASASFDYTLKIWNIKEGRSMKTLTQHTQAVVALAYSHDGSLLASTSDDKTIKLWSTKDYSLIKEFHQPEHPQAVSFSPDGEWLITGGRDKPLLGEFLQNFFGHSHHNPGVSMRLWHIPSGKLVQTFRQHADDANDVDFSPDGKHILSAGNDGTVRLWSFP